MVMHHRRIRLAAGASLVFLVLVVFPTQAQTDERCFTETGYCIRGRIREFWERNGALPAFGLPITPQREELIEGKPVEVQWFERNRLELHPANQRPFDVLLGRLGVDTLAQQGRNWQDLPRASGPQPDCKFFPETGQNVCSEILTAWQVEGIDINEDGLSGNGEPENLALFGLPITGEITETLSDGRVYTVQYFERARFERHPENEPPYNILLGLLGQELMPAAPPPTPTGAPPLTPTGAPPATTPAPTGLPAPTSTPSGSVGGEG